MKSLILILILLFVTSTHSTTTPQSSTAQSAMRKALDIIEQSSAFPENTELTQIYSLISQAHNALTTTIHQTEEHVEDPEILPLCPKNYPNCVQLSVFWRLWSWLKFFIIIANEFLGATALVFGVTALISPRNTPSDKENASSRTKVPFFRLSFGVKYSVVSAAILMFVTRAHPLFGFSLAFVKIFHGIPASTAVYHIYRSFRNWLNPRGISNPRPTYRIVLENTPVREDTPVVDQAKDVKQTPPQTPPLQPEPTRVQ